MATDKFECHKWAVSQSGFDPTRSSNPQGTSADYQRASVPVWTLEAIAQSKRSPRGRANLPRMRQYGRLVGLLVIRAG